MQMCDGIARYDREMPDLCPPDMFWKVNTTDPSVKDNLKDVTAIWDITTTRCTRPTWFDAIGMAMAYAPNAEFVLTMVIVCILIKCGCIQAKRVVSIKDLWKIAQEEDLEEGATTYG